MSQQEMDELKFRNGNSSLIPYIEFNFAQVDRITEYPIAHVILGPSKYLDLKQIALEQFLIKNWSFGIEIINSVITFRT